MRRNSNRFRNTVRVTAFGEPSGARSNSKITGAPRFAPTAPRGLPQRGSPHEPVARRDDRAGRCATIRRRSTLAQNRSAAPTTPSIQRAARHDRQQSLMSGHRLVRLPRSFARGVLPLGNDAPPLRRRHHHEFVQPGQEIPTGLLRQRRERKQQPEHLSHIAHGCTLPSVEITPHPHDAACLPSMIDADGLCRRDASVSYLPDISAVARALPTTQRSFIAPTSTPIPRRRAIRVRLRRRSASITGFVNTQSTFTAA